MQQPLSAEVAPYGTARTPTAEALRAPSATLPASSSPAAIGVVVGGGGSGGWLSRLRGRVSARGGVARGGSPLVVVAAAAGAEAKAPAAATRVDVPRRSTVVVFRSPVDGELRFDTASGGCDVLDLRAASDAAGADGTVVALSQLAGGLTHVVRGAAPMARDQHSVPGSAAADVALFVCARGEWPEPQHICARLPLDSTIAVVFPVHGDNEFAARVCGCVCVVGGGCMSAPPRRRACWRHLRPSAAPTWTCWRHSPMDVACERAVERRNALLVDDIRNKTVAYAPRRHASKQNYEPEMYLE